MTSTTWRRALMAVPTTESDFRYRTKASTRRALAFAPSLAAVERDPDEEWSDEDEVSVLEKTLSFPALSGLEHQSRCSRIVCTADARQPLPALSTPRRTESAAIAAASPRE